MRWEDKTTHEILVGLEAEASKTQAIIRDTETNLITLKNKVSFILASIHFLKSRYGDNK